MREIKFRVWNNEENCWDQPSLVEVFSDDGVLGHLYDSERKYTVIEQYTGKKDKNGVEIYEGDILMPAEGADVWANQKKGVTVKDIREPFGNAHLFEVVSNIHEKPKKSAPIAFGVGDHPDYKHDDSI